MKVVVSNKEVARFFRYQNQSYATNPGRTFYYNTNEIFSFGGHFCVAKLDGGNVIISEKSYSVSTAKHVALVEDEMTWYNKIYCANPIGTHAENFDFWLKKSEEVIDKFSRARKPVSYKEKLRDISYKATKYSKYFKEKIPDDLKRALKISTKEEAGNYETGKVKRVILSKAREVKEFEKMMSVMKNIKTTFLIS